MRRALFILLVVGFFFAALAARTVLDPRYEREMLMDMAYLPNGRMLGWISGGMDDILSDLLWLRSLRYVMDHFGSDRDYTYLYRVYDIITDFDPNFVRAYRFGGYFLTGVTDEYGYAVDATTLLKKGLDKNPDSWEMAYELGSVYNLNLKDPISAAEWFGKAAENPDCPSMIREHATVIFEEKGRLEQALAMWRRVLNGAESGGLKKVADWNVKRVESLILIEKLEAFVARFKREKGTLPGSISDLVRAGLIRFVPRDAFGEELIYLPSSRGKEKVEFTLCSRDVIRRALDKRIAHLRRRILQFKRKQGRLPSSMAEAFVDTDALWKSMPFGIQLDYDPETGELSYDRSFEKYGLYEPGGSE